MTKLFLDTNIFLRFMVPENQTSFSECAKIGELAEKGQIIPYVSSIVIQEIIYTLLRTYKFSRQEVLKKLPLVFELRNLTMIEKTDTLKAFKLYAKYNIKFGDCLIAAQIPKNLTICTYDLDFQKIPGLLTQTPSEICKHMSH